ncbi:MAG: hypothetical protein BMS9Abin32_069 [Gammaproteobacteria bacterium]|nr:MAG: hypothetical protein BMS9Abin32_069 [Gammaproteobacteria bacterium]
MSTATEPLLLQLRMLGDLTRMRLVALCREGECSVSELTAVIGQSQPRISQQLKQLCGAGLLQRFRDGKQVFYRVPGRSSGASRQTLQLVPVDDPLFMADRARLHRLRGAGLEHDGEGAQHSVDRALHRALIQLTVTAPVGALLDIGCGRGHILRLLASRAHRAVGVDIDAGARRLARAELMLAGVPNCSLRQGDMYRLPFADGEFDTVVLDDVLAAAQRPVAVLQEARRLLNGGGRLLVLLAVAAESATALQKSVAEWCAGAGLRLAPARLTPKQKPRWLLAVATAADRSSVAA